MRAASARLGLAVLSGVAALLGAEALLRVATGPDFASAPPLCDNEFFAEALVFDPVLGWRNRRPGAGGRRCGDGPGAAPLGAEINGRGFRGPELAVEKAPGTLRIACLGDSGTFGILASDAGRGPGARRWRAVPSYPRALARRLGREGFADVEVVNAGVIGYSSSHGLRQLVLRILELDPDVVTVRFGANDAMPAWAPALRAIEPDSRLARAGLYAFADWRLLRLALRSYQSVPRFHPEPESVPWTTDARFRRNLERIVAIVRGHGAQVLLIDYPLGAKGRLPITDLGRRMPGLQTILREVARQSGAPLLESAPALEPPRAGYFDPSDAVHLNERGARRLADLVFERLRSRGWLDPPAAAPARRG